MGKGIDFQAFAPHLRGRIGLAVNEEPAQRDPIDVARGFGNVICLTVDDLFHATDWPLQRALVVRRQNQVLATLALVETGCPHIDDKTEERVVHRPGTCTGWNFHDRRAIFLQVENGNSIDRAGIACQEQGRAVHQVGEVHNLVRLRSTKSNRTKPQSFDGGRRYPAHKGFDTAQKIEVVIDQRRGFSGGNTVKQLQRPIRVSTLSGVMTVSGILVLNPGVGSWANDGIAVLSKSATMEVLMRLFIDHKQLNRASTECPPKWLID